MDGLIWSAGGLGFILGMRHALDPDHVVAVSTIASEQRSLLRSSLVGGFWGIGHALSLMVASGVVLALKLNLGGFLAVWLESAVAVMLILLGVRAIRLGIRDWTIHAHRHAHDGREHVHLHQHHKQEVHADHQHRHILGFGLRPFSVGIAHGLAGSAALAIVAAATTTSLAAGLLYVGMLGIGSAAGMMILTAVMSLPLVLLTSRFRSFRAGAQLAAGIGSIAFGVWWMWSSGAVTLLG
ncbi:MAG TPA: urease accessory protein UreH [Thermoanaerobaculia bacterium]|nr:urease accessory protein UreH [Thermoanaerobaculia bacterium]